MYLTVHAAAGLALARLSPHPVLTFILGLASHLLLDAIPHGDEHLAPSHFAWARRVRRLVGAAVIDALVLAGFLSIYLWVTPIESGWNLAAGVTGALLPDAVEGVYLITRVRFLESFDRFHVYIQSFAGSKIDWAHGIFVQVMTFTGLWLTLL